ncbi:transposase domain-containing protein [Caenispirillum salinarum]
MESPRFQCLRRFSGPTIYTLIETARMNGLDPEAYLTTVLTRIPQHPINRID